MTLAVENTSMLNNLQASYWLLSPVILEFLRGSLCNNIPRKQRSCTTVYCVLLQCKVFLGPPCLFLVFAFLVPAFPCAALDVLLTLPLTLDLQPSLFRSRHGIVPVQRIRVTRGLSWNIPNLVLYVIERPNRSVCLFCTTCFQAV